MPSTIILSDNGASSGSAGLKQTAGNDGVLILQTTTVGGTATNAVYVDTSQNVGIGTSSPSARLAVDSGSTGLIGNFNSTNANGGYLRFQSSGTAIGDIGTAAQTVSGSSSDFSINARPSGALVFGTSNTERARFNAGAPILCLAGGNTSATGTGIAFPATQSASTDANTLDDYEEGTFTPTLGGSVSSPTGVTYSTQFGQYTRIGNVVTIFAYIAFTTYTGGSGTIQVRGLPFTTISGLGGYDNGLAQLSNVSLTAGYTYASLRTIPSNPIADLQQQGSNNGWLSIGFGAISSSGTVKEILASITYFV